MIGCFIKPKGRREFEAERNDRLAHNENTPHTRSHSAPKKSDLKHEQYNTGRDAPHINSPSQSRHRRSASVRGVGGLSERNTRLAQGAGPVSSSTRSTGESTARSRKQPPQPVPRSLSAADLREAKMFAKATKIFHDHMKDIKHSTKASCNNTTSTVQQNQQNHMRDSAAVTPGRTSHATPDIMKDGSRPYSILTSPDKPQHHTPSNLAAHDGNRGSTNYLVGMAAMKENVFGETKTPINGHTPGNNVVAPNIGNTPLHETHRSFLGSPSTIYIYDKTNDVTYVKGKLLGKGGFARCHEMTDVKTGKMYAGKIISKSKLWKPNQRDKILREVEIHRNLVHKNVVRFRSFFEDSDNMYIILELCNRKSLVHILKKRATLTEPETRYYLSQIIDGARYMHCKRVIHRDLKLGNMLINNNMHLKIADFGLSTRLEYEGEKKLTLCGTPNYIAPEVLQKKGHSYEADIWAMGCIMYTLLVGRPPFETTSLKETYQRINTNKYNLPESLSVIAKGLITRLLSPNPCDRPSLDEILADDFFQHGYLPRGLPTTCCEQPYRIPQQALAPGLTPISHYHHPHSHTSRNYSNQHHPQLHQHPPPPVLQIASSGGAAVQWTPTSQYAAPTTTAGGHSGLTSHQHRTTPSTTTTSTTPKVSDGIYVNGFNSGGDITANTPTTTTKSHHNNNNIVTTAATTNNGGAQYMDTNQHHGNHPAPPPPYQGPPAVTAGGEHVYVNGYNAGVVGDRNGNLVTDTTPPAPPLPPSNTAGAPHHSGGSSGGHQSGLSTHMDFMELTPGCRSSQARPKSYAAPVNGDSMDLVSSALARIDSRRNSVILQNDHNMEYHFPPNKHILSPTRGGSSDRSLSERRRSTSSERHLSDRKASREQSSERSREHRAPSLERRLSAIEPDSCISERATSQTSVSTGGGSKPSSGDATMATRDSGVAASHHTTHHHSRDNVLYTDNTQQYTTTRDHEGMSQHTSATTETTANGHTEDRDADGFRHVEINTTDQHQQQSRAITTSLPAATSASLAHHQHQPHSAASRTTSSGSTAPSNATTTSNLRVTTAISGSISSVNTQHSTRTPTSTAASKLTHGDSKTSSSTPIRLYQLLRSCLDQMPEDSNPQPEHTFRLLWVTKWVDYSNKYGFGFQLSDKSVGVLFNDSTRIILSSTNGKIGYNDLSNKVYTFTREKAPKVYEKKCTLLLYFTAYMQEHLIHGGDLQGAGGGAGGKRGGGPLTQPFGPNGLGKDDDTVAYATTNTFMKRWFRTSKAMVMHLNNGTFQVNFIDDHTKVILTPDGQHDYLVMYINSRRQPIVYRLSTLKHFGCRREIRERLAYAHRMLERVINVEEEAV